MIAPRKGRHPAGLNLSVELRRIVIFSTSTVSWISFFFFSMSGQKDVFNTYGSFLASPMANFTARGKVSAVLASCACFILIPGTCRFGDCFFLARESMRPVAIISEAKSEYNYKLINFWTQVSAYSWKSSVRNNFGKFLKPAMEGWKKLTGGKWGNVEETGERELGGVGGRG